MTDRVGSAVWRGDLFGGSGTVSAVSSGLFADAEVTWASRADAPAGRTSPEELIASAHAACFAMALANELASRGNVPRSIQIEATATFEPPRITTMVLDVTAEVPALDDSGFQTAVAAAEGSCPVSNALRGGVEIRVRARLSR